MAKKKASLGSDPLGFIHDTRPSDKLDKLSHQDKMSIQDKLDNAEKLSNMSKLSKLDNPDLQKLPNKPSPDDWVRATFIMRHKFMEQIKALAYWDRKEIKEVVDEIMAEFFKGRKIERKPSKKKVE